MLSIHQLKDIIDSHFCAPFIEDGIVKARLITYEDGSESLEIKIGPRDVQFDENGTVFGSGTMVGSVSSDPFMEIQNEYAC